jgi:hypothetical protein
MRVAACHAAAMSLSLRMSRDVTERGTAIVLTSKDANLTKAHARYLEAGSSRLRLLRNPSPDARFAADPKRGGGIRRAQQGRSGIPQPGRAARGCEARLGAAGYAFTRSPDAADLSMAAMTSWRRTASVKSGTV